MFVATIILSDHCKALLVSADHLLPPHILTYNQKCYKSLIELTSSLRRAGLVTSANLVSIANEISLLNHDLHLLLGQTTMPIWLNFEVLNLSIVHLCRRHLQKTVFSDGDLNCDLLGAFGARWDVPDLEVA